MTDEKMIVNEGKMASKVAANLSSLIASQSIQYAALQTRFEELQKQLLTMQKENTSLRKEVAKYESRGNHTTYKQSTNSGKQQQKKA